MGISRLFVLQVLVLQVRIDTREHKVNIHSDVREHTAKYLYPLTQICLTISK